MNRTAHSGWPALAGNILLKECLGTFLPFVTLTVAFACRCWAGLPSLSAANTDLSVHSALSDGSLFAVSGVLRGLE